MSRLPTKGTLHLPNPNRVHYAGAMRGGPGITVTLETITSYDSRGEVITAEGRVYVKGRGTERRELTSKLKSLR